MRSKIIITIVLLNILYLRIVAQVVLTESNLPIIVFNTSGVEIPDDKKVMATMKVYYKEDGGINKLTDIPIYDRYAGIETRGQSSQELFPKKSYSIETRKEDNTDDAVALLGMPKESDWVLHAPYSDKSLMRNALLYTMAGMVMEYAPRVKFVEVIVNNNYAGVYLFTEKIKRDDNRINIANLKSDDIDGDELTGGYILKFDKASQEDLAWESPYSFNSDQPAQFVYVEPKSEDIVVQQKDYIRNWMTGFENVLASPNYADPINGYRKYIDVPSFIDLILLNEISRNVDAYRLSTYMYKDKDSKDGKLHVGPVWDYNLSFGNANYCEGSNFSSWAYDFNAYCPNDYWTNHFWWKRLISDPSFYTELKTRYTTLRQGIFSTSALEALILGFKTELQQAQGRNFTQWPILNEWVWPNFFVGGSHSVEVSFLLGWLKDRLAFMDEALGVNVGTEDGNNSAATISISPNPAVNELVVHNTYEAYDYEVYDMSSSKVLHGRILPDTPISIFALDRGIYIIKLIGKEKATSLRFVKY